MGEPGRDGNILSDSDHRQESDVAVVVVVGCCFSHSPYWLPTRQKLLYTVVSPARGLLNRGKGTKEKVWQRPPPPHTHCSFGENKNKIT